MTAFIWGRALINHQRISKTVNAQRSHQHLLIAGDPIIIPVKKEIVILRGGLRNRLGQPGGQLPAADIRPGKGYRPFHPLLHGQVDGVPRPLGVAGKDHQRPARQSIILQKASPALLRMNLPQVDQHAAQPSLNRVGQIDSHVPGEVFPMNGLCPDLLMAVRIGVPRTELQVDAPVVGVVNCRVLIW